MSTTFSQLGLPGALTATLAARGITEPFPIQQAAIPDALAGRDLAGKAPTGSGKTLAFGLPLLARVGTARSGRPRSLVLAPTRELAEQISQELAPLARAAGRTVCAVYGGVGYRPQISALRRGADVLVATPGRLEDLIDQGAVRLSDAGIVVVDEADRMADMGFLPAVRRILDATPRDRQTMLFSATLDGAVAVLSRDYQVTPVRHEAAAVETEALDIDHHFWLVEHPERVQAAADVVTRTGRSIVFTRTRHGADRLARQLERLGVETTSLHGGRTQSQRNRALDAFSSGRVQALIATDVAARGIHVDDVASVVHFDPPADHKDYLHRSGRTGRAGATGTVVSLVTPQQRGAVRRLQRELDLDAPLGMPRAEDLPAGRVPAPARRPAAARHSGTTAPAPKRPRPRTAVTTATPAGAESVYVANLPWDATGDDVEALFSRHGRVHQATVIVDKRTGRSKGYGFVDMPGDHAREAVARLHGADMEGRDLTVRIARPRTWGAA